MHECDNSFSAGMRRAMNNGVAGFMYISIACLIALSIWMNRAVVSCSSERIAGASVRCAMSRISCNESRGGTSLYSHLSFSLDALFFLEPVPS